MNRFLTCNAYENNPWEYNWEEVRKNDFERQFEIAKIVKIRQRIRKNIIDNYEACHLQI